MTNVKSKQRDRRNYPGVEKQIKKSIQELVNKNNYGNDLDGNVDDIFNWWISKDSLAKYKGMKQNYKINYG
jgi:hypothetical protein